TGGVRTVSLAFLTAASHVVTVSEVGGTIFTNTTTVNVVSGDATQLIASGQATTAGATTTTTAKAKDAYGNTVTSYTGTVAFTSSDAQAMVPGNYAFVTVDAGQHSFSVTLKTAGAQTVTVTDAARSIVGIGGFSVSPAVGASCAVRELPASAAAGAQLGFQVTVSDAFANVATGYSGTMTLSSSDTAAQLSAAGTYTLTDAGSRAFSAQLRTAGSQTVTAADSANSITCQGSVNVVPAATLFVVSFVGTDAWAGT